MKHQRLFILLMLGFFAFQVSAQVSIGVKTGVTRAWEDYGIDLPEDAEIHVKGFNIAAMAYVKLNKFLSIGIEPGYIERGAACVPGWNLEPDPIFAGDTEIFLKYIDVPLMASASLPLFNDKCRITGKAGYGFAYLSAAFDQVTQLDGSVPPVRSKIDLDTDSRLHRWDHGIHGAVNFGYRLGKGTLFVESAYFAASRDANTTLTSRNRNLNFNLGYLLEL